MARPAPGDSVREGLKKLGYGSFAQTPEEKAAHQATVERVWEKMSQPSMAVDFEPPYRLKEPDAYEF